MHLTKINSLQSFFSVLMTEMSGIILPIPNNAKIAENRRNTSKQRNKPSIHVYSKKDNIQTSHHKNVIDLYFRFSQGHSPGSLEASYRLDVLQDI